MKKIGKLVLSALLMATLWSCNDDDPAPFEFMADVITTKRMIDDEAKFAQAYYVYANNEMSSANVLTPLGVSISLSGGDYQDIVFLREPLLSDYSVEPPVAGSYQFIVANDSIEYLTLENHIFSDLSIPVIDSIGIAEYATEIDVQWQNNLDADAFVIRIFDAENEPVFSSYYISNDINSLTISEYSGTWEQVMVYENTYTLEVQALLFDTITTDTDYNKIETIAVSSTEFVWIQ